MCDGTDLVVIDIDDSAVDTSTPGSYSVIYGHTDSCDNAAVLVARTVNVVDTTAPVLINASTTSGTNDTVHVTFSEALSAAAESASHFAIDGGITVSAAAFDGGSDRIVLSTSAMGTTP